MRRIGHTTPNVVITTRKVAKHDPKSRVAYKMRKMYQSYMGCQWEVWEIWPNKRIDPKKEPICKCTEKTNADLILSALNN